jgi:hypothetical protein
MRQLRSIAFGLAVLLGVAGWVALAGAQTPDPAPYVDAPVPHATAAPAAATPTSTTPAPAGKPPLAPGGVSVRINGRMVVGFGAASESGRSR